MGELMLMILLGDPAGPVYGSIVAWISYSSIFDGFIVSKIGNIDEFVLRNKQSV